MPSLIFCRIIAYFFLHHINQCFCQFMPRCVQRLCYYFRKNPTNCLFTNFRWKEVICMRRACGVCCFAHLSVPIELSTKLSLETLLDWLSISANFLNEFYVNRVHKIDYGRRRGAVLFIMMGVNILSGIFLRIVITVNKQMAKQESTGKHSKTDCCRMPIYGRRNPLLSVLAIAKFG